MGGPIATTLNPAHTFAKLEIPLAGNGDDDRALNALATLRGEVLPATLGRVPGVSYAVTGVAAGTHDFNETTKRHWPLVFAFVLGLAFLLLLVTFRSLVIPLTAIVLNLFPEQHPQERLLAGVWFLARYGETLPELLVGHAGQECAGHRVIYL